MSKSNIQIGMPCVYEEFCFWTGIAIAVFFVGLIAAIIISVWRDKLQQQNRQKQRRKDRAKK